MAAPLHTRRFNSREFHRMTDAGIFGEDDRLELVEGEIVEMAPIGPRHAACVLRLTTLLAKMVGDRALVSVQNPVQLDSQSELYPDVAVLRHRSDQYAQSLPRPADVILLIEVADTSIEFDRTMKVPRYAQAAIPEVWLVDLPNSQIHVYTDRTASGYRVVRALRGAAELQPSQFPDCRITVDSIFP